MPRYRKPQVTFRLILPYLVGVTRGPSVRASNNTSWIGTLTASQAFQGSAVIVNILVIIILDLTTVSHIANAVRFTPCKSVDPWTNWHPHVTSLPNKSYVGALGKHSKIGAEKLPTYLQDIITAIQGNPL